MNDLDKHLENLHSFRDWLSTVPRRDRRDLGIPVLQFLEEIVRTDNYPSDLPEEGKRYLRKCLLKLLIQCQRHGIIEGNVEVIKEKMQLDKKMKKDKIVMVEFE